MQKFSYHTHTDFSDGANTIEEMLAEAVKLGWKEIGISDHLIIHKNIDKSEAYGYPRQYYFNNFAKALEMSNRRVEEIKKAAKSLPIKTYVGFEMDFFTYPGWLEEFKNFKKQTKADYLQSGNHSVFDEGCNKITDLHLFAEKKPSPAQKQEYVSRHFDLVRQAAASGLFSFIAHLDYPRWAGLCGEEDFYEERMAIIEALAQSGTAFELSTKGLRSIGDFYPARWMLEELNKRNVPVVISDDAHQTGQLGYAFDQAEALLKELNYKNRFKL